MMQRVQRHPPGTFLRCSGCGKEPVHVTVAGTHSSEPVRTTGGMRHVIECCPCGRRTARHDTLDLAVKAWGTNHAQAALPLRIVATRKGRAAA